MTDIKFDDAAQNIKVGHAPIVYLIFIEETDEDHVPSVGESWTKGKYKRDLIMVSDILPNQETLEQVYLNSKLCGKKNFMFTILQVCAMIQYTDVDYQKMASKYYGAKQ